jgi:hypothetical protein
VLGDEVEHHLPADRTVDEVAAQWDSVLDLSDAELGTNPLG